MLDCGPYSPLKVLHHPERLSALRRGEQIVPAHVQVILSDYCNEDCSFCSYRVSGNLSNELFNDEHGHNPMRMIPAAKVTEILDDCVAMGVQAIQLTGGGEPTVHPAFVDVLRQVLARGLRLSVVTNGVKVTEGAVRCLVDADWVRVSLDAATQATYAEMRRVPANFFGKACDTIRRLSQAKKLCGSSVELGVGFVVTRENFDEIEDAASLARDLGADNIRISAAFLPENESYHADHFASASGIAKLAEGLSTASFKVFNRFGDRIEDLKQRSPDYHRCGYQQFTTYIGADLNVYRCCNLAYSTRGIIGSLKGQSFRSLWESQEKTADFQHFDASGCSRCQFNTINRVLNYALDADAPHVSFV